ncbi:MAG: hypothetical protein ACTSYI_08160 [Promethearchaeota archaeon]
MPCRRGEGGNDEQILDMQTSTEIFQNPKLFFAHLRQPTNFQDAREDPVYFNQTFGTYDCHQTLLSSNKVEVGDRFAFLQGGKWIPDPEYSTVKITFITTPITHLGRTHDQFYFIHWSNDLNYHMSPLRYEFQYNLLEQPNTHVFTQREIHILSILNPSIINANRDTKAGRISSCMRSYSGCLDWNSFEAQLLYGEYCSNIIAMQRQFGNVFAVNNEETFRR